MNLRKGINEAHRKLKLKGKDKYPAYNFKELQRLLKMVRVKK